MALALISFIAFLLIGGMVYVYIQTKQIKQSTTIDLNTQINSITKNIHSNIEVPSVPTASLTANPIAITVGQATTLTTSSANAKICSGIGTDGVKFYGTGAVFPTKTTTYTYTCYESLDQTGKFGSASVTVSVSPAPTSTTTPYINKATTDMGIDGVVMHISGIGFTTFSVVHIRGNGVDILLFPTTSYATENGSDGKNIGLSLPNSININKQYSVYISNGSTVSNTVLVAVPFRG